MNTDELVHLMQGTTDRGKSWENLAAFKHGVEAKAYVDRHNGNGGVELRIVNRTDQSVYRPESWTPGQPDLRNREGEG